MEQIRGLDKYFELKNIAKFTSTDDGKLVAVQVSRTFREKGKDPQSAIEVYDAGEARRILEINDPESHLSLPAFSPDGTRIAYAWKKSKEAGFAVSHVRGGEGELPERITLPSRPAAIQFSSRGGILFTMADPEDKDMEKRRNEGDDQYFLEEDQRYTSLYSYIPGEGIQRITEDLQVWEFHEDSGKVVMVASREKGESAWYGARIVVMDLSHKTSTEVYDPGWRELSNPVLGSGGKIAFLESICSDRGLTSGDILLCSTPGKNVKNITEGSGRTYCHVKFSGGKLYALWRDVDVTGISVYGEEGHWKDLWKENGTAIPGFAPSFSIHNQGFILPFTNWETSQEVYHFGNGARRPITSLNTGIQRDTGASADLIEWESKDGMKIYGYLLSRDPGSPLVVHVHGGPTSFSYPAYLDSNYVLLENGFSVFMPNYRGSTGKGRKYAEANIGDMGGMDFQDILSGIEHLRKIGKVRTDSLFIKGGSYGGFMTLWAMTQTGIFKAGVGMFGISNWVSFHGTTNIAAWDAIHYNEDPYKRNLFEKFSPLNYIDRVETPLLIMQGEQDPCVPPSQSLEMYRALKDRGKNCRLLMFPREGHGFSEKKHVEAEMREMVDWFRKYS